MATQILSRSSTMRRRLVGVAAAAGRPAIVSISSSSPRWTQRRHASLEALDAAKGGRWTISALLFIHGISFSDVESQIENESSFWGQDGRDTDLHELWTRSSINPSSSPPEPTLCSHLFWPELQLYVPNLQAPCYGHTHLISPTAQKVDE